MSCEFWGKAVNSDIIKEDSFDLQYGFKNIVSNLKTIGLVKISDLFFIECRLTIN